jgi:hypothetical protein
MQAGSSAHFDRNTDSPFASLEELSLSLSALRWITLPRTHSLIPHLCLCVFIYLYREIISKDKTHKSCFELTAICHARRSARLECEGLFLKNNSDSKCHIVHADGFIGPSARVKGDTALTRWLRLNRLFSPWNVEL